MRSLLLTPAVEVIADPQVVAVANKLATWPVATAPNQSWVGDITYLALATGQWAYLACWRDAFSRRVVGWHVSASLHTDLILTAFIRAVAVCQPPPGLLVHADRGSQYTSEAFATLLNCTQAIASLSRSGNPYDNALVKNAWSTLKTELLPRGACFADVEEARVELAEYLDHYYNTQRLHSTLGYCTPLEVEHHYLFNLPSPRVRLYPTTSGNCRESPTRAQARRWLQPLLTKPSAAWRRAAGLATFSQWLHDSLIL